MFFCRLFAIPFLEHDWFCLAVMYIYLHPSSESHKVGTAPGVILASGGIVILQTDSVSADAHFLPSFSMLMLGRAFLSCFPVMFFILGKWSSSQCVLQPLENPIRWQQLTSQLRNAKRPHRPRRRLPSSCVVATLVWPLGGTFVFFL